uniref:Uncharacterized protein n=1 Tax=Ditylenchus dipsaci TaxID=166011 RepID=A0A915DVA5_9BILA
MTEYILEDVLSFLPRIWVARNMEGMSSGVQQVIQSHLKTLHVFPELIIKPKNGILGSLEKEDLYIGQKELFMCGSVPKCVRFQMVTLSCGVTLASEEIWEFLRLNKHAFVGCHLAFGRIANLFLPKLDLLFSDIFDQCSRIVLLWPYDGPEWDRELLGNESNYRKLFKQMAFLLCDEVDYNAVYVHEIVDWIGFGIANDRPRRLFFGLPTHCLEFMLNPVHQWCLDSNYKNVDFKIYYNSRLGNCSFDIVKKENSADVPRSNCPANCAQRIMTNICSYPNQYEITNFSHTECVYNPEVI